MKIALALMICMLSTMLKAQNDTSVFTNQKQVATSDYVLLVPEKWNNIPLIDISSKDRKFEFTGVGFPEEFNHVAVTATMTLRKYECPKIAVAEDYITTELTSYPDRVTQPGHNFETDSNKILSGEKGTIYTSRYLRRAKVFNYSRYDMIVYSKKRKAAYMFTITFQYRDPTYNFEKENNLKQYAYRFFSNVLLR